MAWDERYHWELAYGVHSIEGFPYSLPLICREILNISNHWNIYWLVPKIFYFHPYLGKWSNLTNIFQRGWNHQLVYQVRQTQVLAQVWTYKRPFQSLSHLQFRNRKVTWMYTFTCTHTYIPVSNTKCELLDIALAQRVHIHIDYKLRSPKWQLLWFFLRYVYNRNNAKQ